MATCARCGAELAGVRSACPRCGTPGGDPGRRPDVPAEGEEPLAARLLGPAILAGLFLAAVALLPMATGDLSATSTISAEVPMSAATPGPQPGGPPYITTAFDVPGGDAQAMALTMDAAPVRLDGYFLVSGGNDNIGFRVREPDGAYVARLPLVHARAVVDYALPTRGAYVLTWDNSFNLVAAKRVTFYWRAYVVRP